MASTWPQGSICHREPLSPWTRLPQGPTRGTGGSPRHTPQNFINPTPPHAPGCVAQVLERQHMCVRARRPTGKKRELGRPRPRGAGSRQGG
eukprot:jgi/Botrbrau1/2543/Bobra.0079s0030.1